MVLSIQYEGCQRTTSVNGHCTSVQQSVWIIQQRRVPRGRSHTRSVTKMCRPTMWDEERKMCDSRLRGLGILSPGVQRQMVSLPLWLLIGLVSKLRFLTLEVLASSISMDATRFLLARLPAEPTESGPSSVSWLALRSMAEWAEMPPEEEVDRRGRGVETTSVIFWVGRVCRRCANRCELGLGRSGRGVRSYETFGLTPCFGKGGV